MAQAASKATSAPIENMIAIGEEGTPIHADKFRKIVGRAIERESEASAFYQSAAGKVNDVALKTLFRDFAGDKLMQCDFLESYREKDPRVMNFEVRDYRVTDSLRAPEVSAGMKPLEGVVLAIRKELESAADYLQLAEAATDAGPKKLYTDLASMAKANKGRLEEIYTNMAFPEAW